MSNTGQCKANQACEYQFRIAYNRVFEGHCKANHACASQLEIAKLLKVALYLHVPLAFASAADHSLS
jgi:hypothetical protein